MSASQTQSSLNSAPGAGTTWGPSDTKSSDYATPAMSVGSATAAGHGQHPKDLADDSNATLSSSKIGPQKEDLEGEQMRAAGEGDVMQAQFDKKDAGWGEEGSYTSDLDRQKAEQESAREQIKEDRRTGKNIDGGAGGRLEREGLSQA
ncbi:hypothetical protein BP6252_01874 [Coleophoma cylindrospora]|uniref:Uncharacterized protein n=1 Tax=Coleophoma cylindrospora TaxID=1849047 RepID=A0A3D8SDV5_9HELO|nr:hypothetical protein BP6252_01874 [Coleophoma cylindrospora]